MKSIRTPESRFENLPGYPYKPNYIEIDGLRMHYLDEGKGDVILCLHGEPSWSYLYRKFIPVLSPNARIICPDLFGFGKSDKPTSISDYSFDFHLNSLKSFLKKLELNNITVVVQDWGGLLGLSLLGDNPELFSRVVIMNTFLPIGKRKMPAAFTAWKTFALNSPFFPIGKIISKATARDLSKEIIAAYDAPFPDKKYKAGARAFPALVPSKPTDPGVATMTNAREVLKKWTKPALVMFSDKDPIMRGGDEWFNGNIPSREDMPIIEIKNAGHFLQEDAGEEIANHILDFIR
ncbi:MAG: haloalkane dehalogenase [Limisphaerales bacterium]|jgi:haloalkane dehalogenase